MKLSLIKTASVSGFLMGLLFSQGTIAGAFWEITDSNLSYIARVRADPNWGSVVIYNPVTCKQIGAACGFFRTHAHAHAMRNHLLLRPEAYPYTLEDEADCWAAKNGKSNETYAAVQFFLDEDRDPEIKITGEPLRRAEKIKACAIKAGKWPEE